MTAALSSPKSLAKDKPSFPLMLAHMLALVESLGMSHIICWAAGGESFIVYDEGLLVSEVLPRFFK